MKPTTNRTQYDYPLTFKLAVAEQAEKGELTYKQAQDPEQYEIQGFLPFWYGFINTVD